ncbi:MAG: hypothetical protein ACREK7_06515 [Gemmatimonadota bacterium]
MRMSMVLVTDGWTTILPVLERIEEQTIRDEIEIVLVLPFGQVEKVETADLLEFAPIRLVEVESVIPLGSARAAGVRAATAPLVFIGETHSFPHPGMAQALVSAHSAGWGVIVPAFHNANPDGAPSWAGFLAGYAAWTDGIPAGEIESAPLFNVSYRRPFLLELGNRLPHVLTEGEDMATELRAGGQRIFFEPAADIDHANISFLSSLLRQRLLAGRVIAGGRSASWPRLRRLAYALGSPLIPIVLLGRYRRGISSAIRRQRPPASTLFVLVLGSVFEAAGEMLGYARGEGSTSRARYDVLEVRRLADTALGTGR